MAGVIEDVSNSRHIARKDKFVFSFPFYLPPAVLCLSFMIYPQQVVIRRV